MMCHHVVRDSIQACMFEACKETKKTEVKDLEWRFEPVKLPPRKEAAFGAEESTKTLNDPKATDAKRNNAAYQLAWLKRKDVPIELNCLEFGGRVLNLFLPG